MSALLPLVVSFAFNFPALPPAQPLAPKTALLRDLGQLREILNDRQNPREQSQAALLLLESAEEGAEKLIRQTLRQRESEDTWLALAGAIRLLQDCRFTDEIIAGLSSTRGRIRQAAAETLSCLPAEDLIRRFDTILRDAKTDGRMRQMILWILGRTGRKEAVGVLLRYLDSDSDELRRIAASSLGELTGQNYGLVAARWQQWWKKHEKMTNEQWLQMRLGFQSTRAARLEGELLRTRAQVIRLHQQVYTRLPVSDRMTYLQSLVEQEDAGVRALSVMWCLELFPVVDADKQRQLVRLLLHLTNDGTQEVQRGAVLALGRMMDPSSFERLRDLLKTGTPAVRAAAVRALAVQARGNTAEARVRLKQVVPLLQKVLDDKSLEVVVEAAEALGVLGAPEAGPVLLGLLKRDSEHVRQTAAQALERSADASLVDGLLRAMDDPGVTVRFSLVGALGRAASNGQSMPVEQRKRILQRLQTLVKSDPDAGVRSRAATVLGEHGGYEVLPTLWQQVIAGTDDRVQEKAWDAFVEIVTRSGTVALAERWDRTMSLAKQGSRRVQMWSRLQSRWDQIATMREQSIAALEGLVQAQVDIGKWSAAAPLVQNLLSRSTEGGEAIRRRCLNWWLQIAELALKENNRTEALRIIKEARSYLPKGDRLTDAFDKLEKEAAGK